MHNFVKKKEERKEASVWDCLEAFNIHFVRVDSPSGTWTHSPTYSPTTHTYTHTHTSKHTYTHIRNFFEGSFFLFGGTVGIVIGFCPRQCSILPEAVVDGWFIEHENPYQRFWVTSAKCSICLMRYLETTCLDHAPGLESVEEKGRGEQCGNDFFWFPWTICKPKKSFFFLNFRLILYVCTSSSSRKSDYEFDDEGVLFQKIGE